MLVAHHISFAIQVACEFSQDAFIREIGYLYDVLMPGQGYQLDILSPSNENLLILGGS